MVEHALRKKSPVDGNAINAAGQDIIFPHFNRVRKTTPVEFTVSTYEFLGDPGIRPVAACFHDINEGMINCGGKAIFMDVSFEGPTDMESIERHDGPRVGTIPADVA